MSCLNKNLWLLGNDPVINGRIYVYHSRHGKDVSIFYSNYWRNAKQKTMTVCL